MARPACMWRMSAPSTSWPNTTAVVSPASAASPAGVRPQREHDGEAADGGGGEPVAVLEEHAADHGREDLPEGERPVGNRQPGPGAGDEPAEEEKNERRPRRHHGETMEPGAGTLRHPQWAAAAAVCGSSRRAWGR